MLRLLGSTCAFGLEAIFFGSVMASGVGRFCATEAISLRTVVISMAIANQVKARMQARPFHGKESLTEGEKRKGFLAWGAAFRALTHRRLMHVDSAPRLVAGVAEIFQRAIDALGLAGITQLAPVPDDLMREQNPFVARDHLHQILLNVFGIVFLR